MNPMGAGDKRHYSQRGFTLVEIVMVIVILGIVASIGSSYLVSAVRTYRDVQVRDQLVQRGRLVLEQIARELRMAAPNSVRISSTGNCVEFLPVVASTRYEDGLPTAENGAAPNNTIATTQFHVGTRVPSHAVIAPYFVSEVYTSGNPAARAGLVAYSSGDYSQVNLTGNHQFMRDSVSRRVFLTADPLRFCLSAGSLYRISNYGFLASSLGDTLPGGSMDLMVQNVAADGNAFSLTAGSEDRNAAVLIGLVLSADSASIQLTHQVLIRNVP